MDYWGELVVPAQTPILTPERKLVKVCPGVVKHVWVFFPLGHRGTTRLHVLRHEHQLWPTNLGEWYLGDGTVIEFDENYPLQVPPYEFVLVGYNSSTEHSHTVYVRFTILEKETVAVPLLPRSVGVFV